MRLFRPLRNLLKREERERELEDELRFHVELETEANLRRGLPPEEARRAALTRFGGVEATKEECRDTWGVRFVESLGQDVRIGLRGLRANPGFTAVVVATLALGIGANSAMFSVVNAVLLQPLPYAQGERVVVLNHALQDDDNLGFSPSEVADLRRDGRTLDTLVEYHSMPFTLLGGAEAERVQVGVVSADFFDMLGVKPRLGRTFLPGEDQAGAEPVLVLSHDYWRRSQGGDPGVVGRTFHMNDRVHTVVGVLPPGPQFPGRNDVYMPVSACPFRNRPTTVESRTARMLLAFGRLRDGVRPEQARAELAALTAQFGDRHPDAYPPQARPTMRVTTLRDALTERARPTFLTLLGAVLCILLIVCANVANLMLARLVQREKELAVRSALGAGRRRLMRQLLTESTLLALLGGGLGLLLARGLVGVLSLYAARFTSRAAEIQIDGAVLAFTLAISVLTGLVFGSLPGLPSFRRLAEALHDGARGTPGSAAGRMRHALIAAQLAASFVLLIGAALLMRSVFNLHQVDPGFDAERVVSMRVTLNWSRYSGPDFAPRVLGVFEPLVERVRALPGVESVGAGIRVPLDQAGAFNTRLQIEGRDGGARVEAQADFHLASEDFFRALGVAVLRGRGFTEADAPAAPGTALVNESMERRRFGGDAVGRRLSLDNGQTWLNVVGVVGDVRQSGLDREAADEIYLPFRQNPGFQFTLFVRAQGDPQAVARQVRGVVQQLDPETPVSDVRTLAAVRHEALAAPRLTAVLQGLFAALALLVTATGLSGVVAFSVSRRTQEIGVRMALGAQPADVVRLLLSQAMRSLGLGLVLGAAGALGLGRVLTGLLFGVQPTDAACFAASAVVLVLVALLACFLPARRATAIDPLLALRAS